MKKALTDTGLVKKTDEAGARKRKSSGKKGGKAAPSTPKAKNTTAKAAKSTEPKKPRKQGGKGRPYQPHPWAAYAPGSKAPQQYSEEELRGIVKKAAKAANTRIRALEKKGLTQKSPAYQYIASEKHGLGMERPRFKEGVTNMSRQELNKEFLKLRDFMLKKTSTVTGYRDTVEKKVQKAREMGFTGTPEELSELFDRFWTEENEKIYGSEVLRQAIYAGQVQNIQKIAQQFQGRVEKDRQSGAMLIELAKRKLGRK
jgi:hypothetical protein